MVIFAQIDSLAAPLNGGAFRYTRISLGFGAISKPFELYYGFGRPGYIRMCGGTSWRSPLIVSTDLAVSGPITLVDSKSPGNQPAGHQFRRAVKSTSQYRPKLWDS